MGTRSQRHMDDLPSIYETDSNGEAAPKQTATIANQSTSTTVNVNLSTSFSGDARVYGAVTLPESCSINASTGVVTGTSSAGTYTNCQITVENAQGIIRSNKFTWTVA